MTEPFVTQLDTELPLILILKDGSVFSEAVISSLEKTSFQVVVGHGERLNAAKIKQLVQSARFFRLLLVAEHAPQIQNWWQQLQAVVPSSLIGYAVVPTSTPVRSHPDSNLAYLQIRDVVAAEIFPWNQVVAWEKSQIVAFESEFFPLLKNDLRRIILSFIAHPHPKSVQAMQGTGISGPHLAQHLFRILSHRTHQTWELTSKPFRRVDTLEVTPIQVNTQAASGEFAAQFIRLIKETTPQVQQTALPSPSAQKSVPPTRRPIKLEDLKPEYFPTTTKVPTLRPPIIKKNITPTGVKTEQKPQLTTTFKSDSNNSDSKTVELKTAQELDTMLQKLFVEERVQQKEAVVKELTTTTIKSKKTNKYRQRFYGLSLGILLVFCLLVTVVGISLASFGQVRAATQQGKQVPQWSLNWLGVITPPLQEMSTLFPLPGLASYLETTEFLTSYHQHQQTAGQVNSTAAILWQEILGAKAGNVFTTLSQFTKQTEDQYQQFSLLQARLKNASEHGEKSQWQKVQSELDAQRRNLVTITQLQPILPALLAKDGKRTYSVLLTDQNELRPLSGTIVAVGFVEVSNGVVTKTWVEPSSTIEAQFPGSLAAPQLIQAMFSRESWGFSDSLWEPSFPESTQSVIGILQSGQVDSVEGVMVLPISALGELMTTSGSLTVQNTTYEGETLSPQLLSHFTQASGVVAANLPAAVLEAYLSKLATLSPTQLLQLGQTITSLLQEQKMALYLTQPSEEALLENLGWSGSLLFPTCPTQLSDRPCVIDPFFQVEANLGENKANAFLKRSLSHSINISREGARHTRQITLTNTATSTAWPAGSYHAQFQLYLAPQANLEGISINGQPLSSDRIIQATHDGRTTVLFPLTLEPRQTATIVITYTHSFNQTGEFSYAFFDQKQLGLEADPLSVTLTYSDDLRPTLVAPQAEVQSHLVTFSNPRTSNTFVGISFE